MEFAYWTESGDWVAASLLSSVRSPIAEYRVSKLVSWRWHRPCALSRANASFLIVEATSSRRPLSRPIASQNGRLDQLSESETDPASLDQRFLRYLMLYPNLADSESYSS